MLEITARKRVSKLYKKFEKLLKKHKTTIHRVAVGTGIPPTVLYDWKNGRSNPKLDKLLKLAKYFDVPVEYFL